MENGEWRVNEDGPIKLRGTRDYYSKLQAGKHSGEENQELGEG